MLHEFLQFASENPFLAFFLVAVIASAIVGVFRYLAYMVRGDKTILEDDDDE